MTERVDKVRVFPRRRSTNVLANNRDGERRRTSLRRIERRANIGRPRRDDDDDDCGASCLRDKNINNEKLSPKRLYSSKRP